MRLDDFSIVTRAKTLEVATGDEEIITRTALELLRALDPPRPVRLLGVRLAGLDEAEAARDDGQLELSL